MNQEVIATIASERDDLALHVDLCHQRYLQILARIDSVQARLDDFSIMLHEIRNRLEDRTEQTYKTYLRWAGVIIVALFGIVAGHLTR
jgi:hypothetical protein